MGSSSRPIDHGTNRVGRPKHHTTRIDANPPRYRTCDSHRIRLAQRLINPSRFHLYILSLQSSIKLAFPRRYEMGVLTSPIVCIGLASCRTKEAFWRARVGREGRPLHKRQRLQAKPEATRFYSGWDCLSMGIYRS